MTDIAHLGQGRSNLGCVHTLEHIRHFVAVVPLPDHGYRFIDSVPGPARVVDMHNIEALFKFMNDEATQGSGAPTISKGSSNDRSAASCACNICWATYVSLHVFPYTIQCAGNGNVAVAAHEAMVTIAQQAAEQLLARDASRTFANGLRWFCRHVKEQARSRQAALGHGEAALYDQLADVGSVCDLWLASAS